MSDTSDFGCKFTAGNVTVLVASVEEQFLGLSLTEVDDPLNWRRIGVELHDLDQIRALRDVLSAYLKRRSEEIEEGEDG